MRTLFAVVFTGSVVVVLAGPVGAAEPSEGTVSGEQPTVSWQGKTFIASNPTDQCAQADPACDSFLLTVAEPLPDNYVVDIVIDGQGVVDDFDLYVHDPGGVVIAESATGSGDERVRLTSPPPGTYRVGVLAWLVVPGATYAGGADLAAAEAGKPRKGGPKAFEAREVTRQEYLAGTLANRAKAFPGRPLRVAAHEVGREAAEPTIGVTASGAVFFAAATFDAAAGGLARTETLRSRDGGASWRSVQPPLPGETTEPPTTLDPYLHVDPDTGRVFTIDLYLACSYLLFSATEGDSWQRNPLACGQPVNDHHTITTGPPAGLDLTVGYPNTVYYCFNRVSDSSCGKSLDGGRSFLPAGTAFLGEDPEAGGFCGGLHGHLATDGEGRVFLPKGHCGSAWVAISNDGATTFDRVKINDYVPTQGHEVSLAVDKDDNVFAVWFDNRDHLPYLAVSTDHGRTWSPPAMIAPPGVREVNFPTITAGDAGRIAVTFPGTKSADRDDQTRPWNSYQLVSINAGTLADGDPQTNPLFVWATANDPTDPIHRGDCTDRCGGMFDFLDIQTSPADGSFWATASDTCVGDCISDPTAATADVGQGVAVHQTAGPSLWSAKSTKG